MTEYNGHKNWTQWNVALWLWNNECLYHMMQDSVKAANGNKRKAAARMWRELNNSGTKRTPDGATFSIIAIQNAMRDVE